MDNQLKRECSVDGKVQSKKSYNKNRRKILKIEENTAGKLQKNSNEGTVDVVANERYLQVNFIFNETHVANN